MKKFDPAVIQVCKKIGQFFLERNNGDYEKTNEQIRNLGIQDIEIGIVIKTSRPGYLIGKRGQQIIDLQKLLGKKIKIEEENSIEDLIFVSEPDLDYLDDYFVDEDGYIEMI